MPSATEEETSYRYWSCGLNFTTSGHLICKIDKFRYRNKMLLEGYRWQKINNI